MKLQYGTPKQKKRVACVNQFTTRFLIDLVLSLWFQDLSWVNPRGANLNCVFLNEYGIFVQ